MLDDCLHCHPVARVIDHSWQLFHQLWHKIRPQVRPRKLHAVQVLLLVQRVQSEDLLHEAGDRRILHHHTIVTLHRDLASNSMDMSRGSMSGDGAP